MRPRSSVSMARKAASEAISIRRNGSLNSIQSNSTTSPSSRVALPVQIAMALANRAARCARGQQRFEAADVGFGPCLERIELAQVRGVTEQRADLLEVLPHRRDDGLRRAQWMLLATAGVRPWKLAICRARASMCAVVSSPRACTALSSWLCGNWRIFSTYSMAGPLPPSCGALSLPVTGSTSRYRPSVRRWLRRSSSPQKCWRCSRLVKSRKPKFTGFLIL